MKWYYYVIIVLVVIAIIYLIIDPLLKKKKIYQLFIDNQNRDGKKIYEIIEAKRKEYDYVLKCENMNIYIKVCFTPMNSQICINAKETWELSYGGSKNNYGRVYPNKRYMKELEHYLMTDIKDDEKALKVVLVYKGVEHIIRYLNETELDEINIKKTPYGYKIMQYVSFKEEIDYIIEERKNAKQS